MQKIVDPIIIIGMHRSETTLLSKLLEKCGVFMGTKRKRTMNPFFLN